MNKLGLRATASLSLLVLVSALPAHAASTERESTTAEGLPLGPADLVESRTTTTLEPGVTLTRIVRGEEESGSWTVELSIPGGSTSPDPDAPPTALKDRQSAEELAAELADDGFDARVEEVTTPAMADFAGGTLGWRVRVGAFAGQSDAVAERNRLRAAGYSAGATYTGWDGDPTARGPWRIDVLTIDPKKFGGTLAASFGEDLEAREKTSAMADAAGATAAVNAGFFVFDPRAGAPGDPAGVGVYDGKLLSEPVNGRAGLVIRDDARHTDVTRFSWEGEVVEAGEAQLDLDGVNRVPGLIRNCGGTADDVPTSLPLHDVTCTDADEVVAFTPAFGEQTPAGEGVEVVLDAKGTVVAERSPRGGSLPAGGGSIQAIGDLTDDLSNMAQVGDRLNVSSSLVDADGHPVPTSPKTTLVNGGPELVRDGEIHATPATDGMVRPDDPSFYYGWVHKRHPRTIAGVDAAGRTVLVTADGRSTSALGLSISEAAAVAEALGLQEAINLDGGGSTTMVVDGEVINDPSDGSGERPVGDALLVLPSARGR